MILNEEEHKLMCNRVAHVLAKKALRLESNTVWKEDVPSECFDLILADMP